MDRKDLRPELSVLGSPRFNSMMITVLLLSDIPEVSRENILFTYEKKIETS